MGQKVNPIGLRVGYIRGWDSNWYAGNKTFADKLIEDDEIRKYVHTRMPNAGISKIAIERTLKTITLSIYTARPGIVIGKGGSEVDKMREELKRLRGGKDIQVNIIEIKTPELNARLLGESIAQQLRGRASYRRAMKKAQESAIRAGAKGIKIRLAGRLGGAEMARVEQTKVGRVPLHTLRADIDYALVASNTIYGTIGVKVWIFKKEIYGKPDLSINSYLSEGNSGLGRRQHNNKKSGKFRGKS